MSFVKRLFKNSEQTPERSELSVAMMRLAEFEQNRDIIFPSVLLILCLHISVDTVRLL